VQYWRYLTDLLQGDLGMSLFSRRPVLDDLLTYLPATLELILAAMLLAIVIGIPCGLAAAVWANRWPDYLSRVVALAAISMPRFFLGLLLQLGLRHVALLAAAGRALPDHPASRRRGSRAS
jgi:peptide/nickel transport system permease protein